MDFQWIYLFIGLSLALISIAVFLLIKVNQIGKSLKKAQTCLRQQAIISETVSMLSVNFSIDSIAQIVIDSSLQLIGSEMSAFLTIDDSKLTGFYASNAQDRGCKAKITGIMKKVLDNEIPIRGGNIADIDGFEGLPKDHPKIKNILIVPVFSEQKIKGQLMLANRIGADEFTSDDEDLLFSLGIQAALAIEKAHLYQEVVSLSQTDGLTGLNNRRMFQERLEMEVKRAQRFNREISLLMLDIDHFKEFNDTYGHPQGDEVLKATAKILSQSVRSIDFASRYGGEEFAVILIESKLNDAIKAAERIRSAMEKHIFIVEGKRTFCTISIGAASYPRDAEDVKTLLERADTALYHAKETGRNRVSTFMELPEA